MARIENIDGFARIFRVIFAFCYLICLQKPVESGPVSSRLVAGGIVSNISFLFFSIICLFYGILRVILPKTPTKFYRL